MNSLILFSLISIAQAPSPFNLGHRAGGDYFDFLPENSLASLMASLHGVGDDDPIQTRREFVYLEFDVRETYDNEIVVFHDKLLKRMLPYSAENIAVFNSLLDSEELKERLGRPDIRHEELRIRDLTLRELKSLYLEGDSLQRVPTLNEYLNAAEFFGLIKPMLIEVKYLHSDAGRKSLIDSVVEYKENYADPNDFVFEDAYILDGVKVGLITGWFKFKKSFGWEQKRSYWCDYASRGGLSGIFMTAFHWFNFCP